MKNSLTKLMIAGVLTILSFAHANAAVPSDQAARAAMNRALFLAEKPLVMEQRLAVQTGNPVNHMKKYERSLQQGEVEFSDQVGKLIKK